MQAFAEIGTALSEDYERARREFSCDRVRATLPDVQLRGELPDLELDSPDFLSFVELLSAATGRRIDEDDYSDLASMGRCIAFLTRPASPR